MIDALEAACFERREIRITAFRVGKYLVRRSHPVLGYADPEQREIARALKCHRSHVNRALNQLEAADWLRREAIHRPTRYFPNWLRVLFPEEHERLFGDAESNIIPLTSKPLTVSSAGA